MRNPTRPCKWLGPFLLACGLWGCANRIAVVKPLEPGGCPVALRDAIHVNASVAQIVAPADLRNASGSVHLGPTVGREVMIAMDVSPPVPRVRVLSSEITLLTYGGVLSGWARVARPPAAGDRQSIQVQDGWLEVTPFLPGSALHAYTEAIDVLVLPGAARRAGLTVHPGPLWTRGGLPARPARLSIDLRPEIHMRKLHEVRATIRLRVSLLHLSGAREHWRCSLRKRFPLVDRESERPDLWTVWYFGPHGTRAEVLAISSSRLGIFPAVFRDPQRARAFARWAAQTHAARAGPYGLGLMAAHGGSSGLLPIPAGGATHFVVRQLRDE